ncbi:MULTISPECIES: hypothetical protein [unclassified Microcoleus]|uniref:hypothetical protein n=1 Tax=unclassified Microcoleus TaxID=2642155 RepID=UPI002FD61994
MQLNLFCVATSHQVPVAKTLLESLRSLDVDLAELGKTSRTALVNLHQSSRCSTQAG